MEVKSNNVFQKIILLVIGIGVWVIVLQNAGVITTRQNVYVQGGVIDAEVSGAVNINNQVGVHGTVSSYIINP